MFDVRCSFPLNAFLKRGKALRAPIIGQKS